MEIIPVMDLLGGQVVHAKQGHRNHYQAISSMLTNSSEPTEICDALLALYPFSTLYIADIDRILGTGNHAEQIFRLRSMQPELTIWLDAGCKNAADFAQILSLGVIPVVGSESLSSMADYYQIQTKNQRFILSLDFKNEQFFGPSALLDHPAIWPQDVIVMSMSQVGSHAGIDDGLIQKIHRLAPTHSIYAAGGARNEADLARASQYGYAGLLIASALHQKNIQSHDISAFHKK